MPVKLTSSEFLKVVTKKIYNDLRLFWLACTVSFLFLLPFIIKIVKEGVFGLKHVVHVPFSIIVFVYIPLQILIVAICFYVNVTIIKRWAQIDKKRLNIISICLTLPILLFWLVIIFMLLFRDNTV